MYLQKSYGLLFWVLFLRKRFDDLTREKMLHPHSAQENMDTLKRRHFKFWHQKEEVDF